MTLNKLVLAFLLVFSNITTGEAQRPQPKDSLHDYCAICQNHEHLIIQPPYTRTFRKEVPFILASGAMFAAGFISQGLDYAKPFTEEELETNPPKIEDINKFDRGSALNWSPSANTASNYVLYTTALLPALFLSEHHTGRDIKVLLVMYAEVFTFNYGLTELAKNVVQRPRPYVYNESLGMATRTGSDSRRSFFSGHTSQTAAACFYFAKVIHDYHPDLRKGYKIALWTFAATVPAVNGYLRVVAGKHFPTDVMTGYVVGAATGLIIPQLHRTKKSKDIKEQIQMGIGPYRGNGCVLSMAYRF